MTQESAARAEIHMKRPGSPTAVVAVLATAGLLASLLQTLVVPLIPDFPLLLDTSPPGASWVVTITLITGAVVTPVSGRIGDLFGKRRALLLTLAAAVVGSVVSALTSSLWPMVIGRGLQGCVIGVIPLALGVFRDALPSARISGAIAFLSAILGLGAVAGIPLAGLVAEHFDWHVLFWASALLGALCAVLVALLVPRSQRTSTGRFDVVGTVGLTAGLIGLLLPVVNAAEWGWHSTRTLGLGAAALLVLLAWGAHQLHTRFPIVDLRLAAQRPVLMTNLATVGIGFAVYTMLFVFPQVLQAPTTTGYGFGLSLVRAGAAVLPNGLAALLVAPVATRVVARYGARLAMMAGSTIMAAGYVFIALRMGSVTDFVIAATVVGAGAGTAIAATSMLITNAVPASDTASANGVNTLMRSVGGAAAGTVLVLVLAHSAIAVGTTTFPSQQAFRTSFVVAAAAALVGLALTTLVPGRMPVGPRGRGPLQGQERDRHHAGDARAGT
ncbi:MULTISPECIES: MFS transporter [unclassified Streptomyces]|uniref:MFS transporter n=1 Tax=unclassified Streptomyces TaxID=2593676 RepID=UPI00381A03E2